MLLKYSGGSTIAASAQCLSDRVFIRLDDKSKEKTTSGGVVIARSVDPGSREAAGGDGETGTVVAAGPGRVSMYTGVRLPIFVSLGDRVIIRPYTGTKLDLDGEHYKVVSSEDILARWRTA